MHLAASAWCMVLFSAKGVHVSWCHPGSLMHLLSCSLVPAPCSSNGSRGIHILFDLMQKAALCTPVADYLFDFDSQGLITVCCLAASSPWMSVDSCFSNCSDVF